MDFSSLPPISAGFPSPGELFAEQRLDANDLLRPHAATHFLRVDGDSMRDACVLDGDLLFVDRALPPVHGELIVAKLQAGLVLRRLQVFDTHLVLDAAHPAYPPLVVKPGSAYECWAVVLFVISPRHGLSIRRLHPARPAP